MGRIISVPVLCKFNLNAGRRDGCSFRSAQTGMICELINTPIRLPDFSCDNINGRNHNAISAQEPTSMYSNEAVKSVNNDSKCTRKTKPIALLIQIMHDRN